MRLRWEEDCSPVCGSVCRAWPPFTNALFQNVDCSSFTAACPFFSFLLLSALFFSSFSVGTSGASQRWRRRASCPSWSSCSASSPQVRQTDTHTQTGIIHHFHEQFFLLPYLLLVQCRSIFKYFRVEEWRKKTW